MLRGGAKVFLLDPDGIYRLGMCACLQALPEIERVDAAGSPAEAWASTALAGADLVIVSVDVEQSASMIAQLHERIGCRVLAIASGQQQEAVLAAIGAGAVGVLSKRGLTSDALAAQVRAALHGAGLVPPELLTSLTGLQGGRDSGRLTNREQSVLALFAAGKVTREVASELAYSERTVKSVLHEAVTKLGARSRAQAIAFAVRDGVI
ncbi:DNA-binding transcriptional activator DevR/DosR [Baekduia alba]|uniref:response regulator transcription factor n=1 Tax=Baekduia alba TaxID=2997333 RepID=UPI00234270DB|nr:response regulator transcription factor [Baekduia alba]WCB93500.1 DNA-binding transcriptional activator DevR/DosR [Baekduia alba]